MSNTNTGGPAFPVPAELCQDLTVYEQRGMTLRDYFAAKAIGPILATPWFQHTSSQVGGSEYADQLASECYDIADAMIKQRTAAKEDA